MTRGNVPNFLVERPGYDRGTTAVRGSFRLISHKRHICHTPVAIAEVCWWPRKTPRPRVFPKRPLSVRGYRRLAGVFQPAGAVLEVRHRRGPRRCPPAASNRTGDRHDTVVGLRLRRRCASPAPYGALRRPTAPQAPFRVQTKPEKLSGPRNPHLGAATIARHARPRPDLRDAAWPVLRDAAETVAQHRPGSASRTSAAGSASTPTTSGSRRHGCGSPVPAMSDPAIRTVGELIERLRQSK